MRFRVTVHGVNNYVWPASHRANTNSAGPPLGARLRLKASTNISGYPPYIQKIFRAMKTHGLIVADTGSDMYVSGAFDTRWNNGQLNPAFRAIKASDFEVIQLGWRGNSGPCTAPGAPTALVGSASGLNASFSWSAPATGGALTDYLLEAGRSPGASDAATVTLPASATSFAATGAPGTYYVRVRGRNACGSAVSNEVTVTLSSDLRFCPPRPVHRQPSSPAPRWPSRGAPAPGATSHVFEAGWLPGQANLVNMTMTGTSLGAQAPPGVYFVRARGQNACGTGPASPDAMVAVGCAAPGRASPLTASVAGNQVTLQWNAAPGATDFIVEAGTSSGIRRRGRQSPPGHVAGRASAGGHVLRARSPTERVRIRVVVERSRGHGDVGVSSKFRFTVQNPYQPIARPSLRGSEPPIITPVA